MACDDCFHFKSPISKLVSNSDGEIRCIGGSSQSYLEQTIPKFWNDRSQILRRVANTFQSAGLLNSNFAISIVR